MHDLRVAVRALLATPIVTTVAVLSLALGIGANTAIFSLVNSLLLRTLPVKDPGRLVLVGHHNTANYRWRYAVWDQLLRRPHLFDDITAWSSASFNLASGGETQLVDGLLASGSFFDTLGVRAFLGRTLSDTDAQRGGSRDGPVAVIGYGFWQRRFSGAADVIGRTMALDQVPFTIVGVTPPDFFGADVGRSFDVIVPLGDEPLLHGRESWLDVRSLASPLTVMARLKPGQTMDAATAGLRGSQSQIMEATLPESWPASFREQYLKDGFTLVSAATGNSTLSRRYERPLVTIMVVVVLVLLIACANIANLTLARTISRGHELSVRRALGASRWRLARQLLVESALLAGSGAALGMLVASWVSRLLVRQLSTDSNPVFLDLSIDGHLLTFTIGVAATTALIFGSAPALRAARAAPIAALKAHGPASSGDPRASLASGLVITQVALSVVLVVAAGLFARTFASLATRPLGFDRDRVLVVKVNAQRATIDPTRRIALYERVREAVRALPGVGDAAVSAQPPIVSGPMLGQPIKEVAGADPLPPRGGLSSLNLVSPGWFNTLGTPVVAGREITERDRTGTPPVAVVNEAFVRNFLNGASALGRTVTLFLPGPPPPPIEIVGVAADAVYGSLRDGIPPTLYLPIAQLDGMWLPFLGSVNLSVRSNGGPPAQLARSVAAAIGAVSPELVLTADPLARQVSASLAQERMVATLAGFFGALALLLAALGLYGVTSYGVSRRRAEIGIRMALGAAPGAVVRLVLARVALLIGIGIVVGAGVSAWASRFVATLLYGLEPRDPVTLVGAAAVLSAAGAFAGWLPARRASRIDPAEVLRQS